jgi:hypothetical protein
MHGSEYSNAGKPISSGSAEQETFAVMRHESSKYKLHGRAE